MIEQKFYRKILNRRFAIFLGVKLLIFTVVVGRMYKLQVLDSKKYKTLADENRINVLIHMPNRGLIYDMDGQKIAENITNYSFTITPSLIDDLNQLIVKLSGHIELSHEEINLMKQVYISKKPNRAYVIKNSMNWDEVAKISTNLGSIRFDNSRGEINFPSLPPMPSIWIVFSSSAKADFAIP